MKTRNHLAPSLLSYAVIASVLVFTCIPVFVMLEVTFADPAAFINRREFQFSLQNLIDVLSSGNIWPPMRKSFVVAVGTAFISVALAAPGAYVISKAPGNIGYGLLLLIFFTRMFPEVGIALPVSLNLIRLGLFDTDLGLVLAHLIRVLPLVTWVLAGTFKALPPGLEEAGRVDGCSRWGVLYRIVLPLAKPGLMVGLIFGFLNSWDEFIYASYLSLVDRTLPLTVFYYVNRGGWFLSFTYALIVTVPVLFFTYYFQRHIQAGYLSGAVKG